MWRGSILLYCYIVITILLYCSCSFFFFNIWKSEKWKCQSLSCVFAIPWTIACQTPLSMEFFRQEYWGGQPFPSPGDLPDPGMEPGSPALQADSLLSEPPEIPRFEIFSKLTKGPWKRQLQRRKERRKEGIKEKKGRQGKRDRKKEFMENLGKEIKSFRRRKIAGWPQFSLQKH